LLPLIYGKNGVCPTKVVPRAHLSSFGSGGALYFINADIFRQVNGELSGSAPPHQSAVLTASPQGEAQAADKVRVVSITKYLAFVDGAQSD
jgi:hypothetical protein